jgi:hypothetical protein
MCRNIRLLFNFAPPATEEEIQASALQYVRKVSGMTKPAEKHRVAFERAVEEITSITRRLLLEDLETQAPARDREVERAKAKERGKKRDERLRVKLS